MKWQQQKKQANEITRYVNYLRGEIINDVILLESNINIYLAMHFSEDYKKQNELTDLIFSCSSPSMAFEIKRNLMSNIFQNKHKDYHNENKAFFEDLSFIIKHRNIFAHYLLDTGTNDTYYDDFKRDKTFYFLKYKRVTEPISYNPILINEIKGKIKACNAFSNNLIAELFEK